MTKKLTEKQKARNARNRARAKIIKEANKESGYLVFSSKTINQAVCLCRRRLLVTNKVLEAAGFNPIPTKAMLR